MRKAKNAGGKDGITLIEVVVSIIIAAVAISAVAASFYVNHIFIDDLKGMVLTDLAMQKKIDEIRGSAFDDICNYAGSFVVDGFNSSYNSSGIVYIRDYSDDGNIKLVSVSITWLSRSGRPFRGSVATLVTKDGIDRQ